jgi:hypothetical protein
MLFAKFLTSPFANARIKKMDTGKAEGGVKPALEYNSLCFNFLASYSDDADPTVLQYVIVGDPCETTAPTVTSTSPADNAVDVAVDAVVTATFDESMRASTRPDFLSRSNSP